MITPEVEINEDTLTYLSIMLSKAGYGDVNLLKSYDSSTFISILDYETFRNEYQDETFAINKRANQ